MRYYLGDTRLECDTTLTTLDWNAIECDTILTKLDWKVILDMVSITLEWNMIPGTYNRDRESKNSIELKNSQNEGS